MMRFPLPVLIRVGVVYVHCVVLSIRHCGVGRMCMWDGKSLKLVLELCRKNSRRSSGRSDMNILRMSSGTISKS